MIARRRLRNCLWLGLVIILVMVCHRVLDLSLLVQQYYSGWTMVLVLLCLMGLGVKKRLSILPLGSNSTWAQWHYYGGALFLVLFSVHIEFSAPNGWVELVLAGSTTFVIFVGLGGLFINRIYAKRLSKLDEEIVYERIGIYRVELKRRLEQQLLELVDASQSSTLSSYYLNELASYFAKKQDFFEHVFGSSSSHAKRRSNLEHQLRYLNKEEADFAVILQGYLDQKNALDCHSSLQSLMKYWGVLHAPVALLMVMIVIFHIVMVYAFRGAM